MFYIVISSRQVQCCFLFEKGTDENYFSFNEIGETKVNLKKDFKKKNGRNEMLKFNKDMDSTEEKCYSGRDKHK